MRERPLFRKPRKSPWRLIVALLLVSLAVGSGYLLGLGIPA